MQDTINILSFEFEFNFNLDGSRQILSHVQTINKYFYNHRYIYILRQLCQPCMAMAGADAAHAANACRIIFIQGTTVLVLAPPGNLSAKVLRTAALAASF